MNEDGGDGGRNEDGGDEVCDDGGGGRTGGWVSEAAPAVGEARAGTRGPAENSPGWLGLSRAIGFEAEAVRLGIYLGLKARNVFRCAI